MGVDGLLKDTLQGVAGERHRRQVFNKLRNTTGSRLPTLQRLCLHAQEVQIAWSCPAKVLEGLVNHTLHGVAGELAPSEIADERRSRDVLNGIRGASKGLWGASEQMLETANRRLLTQCQVCCTLAHSVLQTS